MLMPALARQVKAGTVYFMDYDAGGSVQTDRTLATAPTANSMTSSSTTWTMAEKIYRAKIDQSEIEQLGGLDSAQMKAARVGKRAVMGAIETLVVTATMGSAATKYNILNSALKYIGIAKETVLDYAEGRVALFGQRRTIERLKRYTEIATRMTFSGVIPRDMRDVRSISDEQLAAAVGVDVVLGGPAASWGGTYDEYLGVIVLPDPNIDPDETYQFGRTMVLPVPAEGNVANIFKVESFFSDDLKSEVVDTTAWVNAVTFNAEALVILTGFDELNASSTTTTTSTTTAGA
jgi:hypothetical protein